MLVDVTGSVEFGAHVVLEAFEHGKHVVLMNAELDATIGPILQTYAEKHGVILSACDGDEPGVQMNLVRWVQGLGLDAARRSATSRACRTRIATRRRSRASPRAGARTRRWSPSFADGSKISFEQAIVANATGFKVLSARHVARPRVRRHRSMELAELYDLDELRELGGDRRLHGRAAPT